MGSYWSIVTERVLSGSGFQIYVFSVVSVSRVSTSRPLWYPKTSYCIQKRLSVVPVLTQINVIHAATINLFKNVSLEWFCTLGFSTEIF